MNFTSIKMNKVGGFKDKKKVEEEVRVFWCERPPDPDAGFEDVERSEARSEGSL